jgi:hypothetical protein
VTELSDDATEWRWADADGAQQVVDEWELIDSLSSGKLPYYALVWRSGWAEWLPATRVAELSNWLPPGKAEQPVTPTLEEGRTEPPPPPLDHYQSQQTRDAAAKLVGGSTAPGLGPKQRQRPAGAAPPPPPIAISEVPVRPGAAAALVVRAGTTATPPPPPPAPQRPPMPTLVEVPRQGATVTLRPPGAVPPPPRTMPVAHIIMPGGGSEAPGRDAIPTPIPDPIEGTPAPKQAVEDAQAGPAGHAATRDAAPGAQLPRTPSRAAPSRPSLVILRRFSVAFIALAALAALLAVVIVVLLVVRTRAPSSATVGIPETGELASPGPSSASTGPCAMAQRAQKLAPLIFLGVPPYVAAVPGSSRAAIGFAATRTLAEGITLDLKNLNAAIVFRQAGAVPLIGVVPMASQRALRFAADREGGSFGNPRTVDASPPFILGLTREGISISSRGEPRVVWPGEGDEPITEIRAATVPGVGHILTFRRGGQAGRVVAGWLGPTGEKTSALETVESPGRFVGTPVVAANEREGLVAFANRASPDDYWALALATAPHGQVPRRARRFSTPPGGHGAGAISPAVAGLHNGRWLLQWTEGGSGQHHVRAQTLDADLVAVGDPIAISPNEANAGQGVVWVNGETALSLFLVTQGNNTELWGATLRCP